MTELYDSDRVSRIGNIARRFSTAVRVGDEVAFGLVGDPSFPEDFKASRPMGRVTRVKGVGTDSASIRVRLKTGSVVDIMPHTIDPRRVWEFTDEHFPKVLARTRGGGAPAASTGKEYRNSAPAGSYEALVAKVDALTVRLDEEIRENRNFSGALVASFNEMAGEVSKVSPDSPFCKTFTNEYKGMMRASTEPKTSSPFESDFSDSDVE